MNKLELIEAVGSDNGLTKSEAEKSCGKKGHRGQTYTIDKCNFVFNFVILGTLRKRRLKPAWSKR
jgi:hypothetical protein